MKFACARSITIVLALFAGSTHAKELATRIAGPPSLECVAWTGSGVALSDLRGKSVVILVYATSRQPANDWPTQFLAELKRASQNKPVVILAISADKKTDIGLAYMNAREFNGPNILHGRDPLMPARLGLKSEFFNYVLIGPTGTLVESGDASRHFTDGAGTRYALARKISRSENLGEFEIIDEQMPAKIQRMLWPFELGRLPSATDLKKLRMGLDEDGQRLIDAAFDRYLDAEIKRIRAAPKARPKSGSRPSSAPNDCMRPSAPRRRPINSRNSARNSTKTRSSRRNWRRSRLTTRPCSNAPR